MDIFFTDLPRALPDKDIDFAIDVEMGTKPNSIPPYCMTLTDLKELTGPTLGFVEQGIYSV